MNDKKSSNMDEYISAPVIDTGALQSELQVFFSSRSLRIPINVVKDLVKVIEEIVDKNHNNTINDFLYYLNNTYNLKFIREQDNEIVIFNEDTTNIDEFENI